MGRKISRKRLAVALGIAAVVAGVVIVLALKLGHATDENYTIRGVLPQPDGALLLVERAGVGNNTYDRGRLRQVTRDGVEVRRSTAMKSALVVHGIVGGHVWLTSHERGLEAWRLTDLAPAPGAKAIAAHAMLSRKRNVVGLTDDAVVVRAADDKLYTITSSYAIAQQPKGFVYRAVAPRSESVDMLPLAVEDGRAHVRLGAPRLNDTDLVKPSAVLELDPTLPPEAAAILAQSIDFEGAGNSAIVSRVEGGKVRWSITARDVLGAHGLGRNAGLSFKLAELREGSLWLVAEAGMWYRPRRDSTRSRGHGEYVHQIVNVDVATGAIRSSHRIK
jgi:hypothetical protein